MLLSLCAQVHVLNLVKSRERKARESILLNAFGAAVQSMNARLPDEFRIAYDPWDLHLNSHKPGVNVLAALCAKAEAVLARTGIFAAGAGRTQRGLLRTNCVDSLDRTNVAQFCFGKTALCHQLHALHAIPAPELPMNSDIVAVVVGMYEAMGDHIAQQYAGSAALNSMTKYDRGDAKEGMRSNKAATKGSRLFGGRNDMLTLARRFYSNNFTDADKQLAIDLFLGNYVAMPGEKTPLWKQADHTSAIGASTQVLTLGVEGQVRSTPLRPVFYVSIQDSDFFPVWPGVGPVGRVVAAAVARCASTARPPGRAARLCAAFCDRRAEPGGTRGVQRAAAAVPSADGDGAGGH